MKSPRETGLRTRHLAAADWVSFALNSGGETYSGISYTQIYTLTDEVVFPNLPPVPSTALHTGEGEDRQRSRCRGSVRRTSPSTSSWAPPTDWVRPGGGRDHATTARRTQPGSAARYAPQALMPGVNPLTLPLNEAR